MSKGESISPMCERNSERHGVAADVVLAMVMLNDETGNPGAEVRFRSTHEL